MGEYFAEDSGKTLGAALARKDAELIAAREVIATLRRQLDEAIKDREAAEARAREAEALLVDIRGPLRMACLIAGQSFKYGDNPWPNHAEYTFRMGVWLCDRIDAAMQQPEGEGGESA